VAQISDTGEGELRKDPEPDEFSSIMESATKSVTVIQFSSSAKVPSARLSQ